MTFSVVFLNYLLFYLLWVHWRFISIMWCVILHSFCYFGIFLLVFSTINQVINTITGNHKKPSWTQRQYSVRVKLRVLHANSYMHFEDPHCLVQCKCPEYIMALFHSQLAFITHNTKTYCLAISTITDMIIALWCSDYSQCASYNAWEYTRVKLPDNLRLFLWMM